MNYHEYITQIYKELRFKGLINSQKDLANALCISEGTISRALKGDERFLTDSLISKLNNFVNSQSCDTHDNTSGILVIPTEAIAGTLGDFSDHISLYDCEKMTSPIKGVDYAMKVAGESMSPEYPAGSVILIKKINENAFIEWGKTYVLDTDNGAVVKKVYKTENPTLVECRSVNPSYQPFTIDTSFIHGWYRVLMVLSQK